MSGQKQIVFCTTVRNRLAHLQATLPVNLGGNPLAKFVVLNYNSPDNLLDYLRDMFQPEIESGRLTVYSYFDSPVFQMAKAKNMAHRCGILEGADVLVNLDADGYAGANFDRFILDKFEEHGEDILLQAMWNRWVMGKRKKRWVCQDENGTCLPPVPKGSNGRMVVTTKAFWMAGGYDEKYNTWGPDDKDFNIRLRRLGMVPHLIPHEHLETVLHNDKVRFRDYPEAKDTKSYEFRISVHDSEETIANFGNVGCGRVYRNLDRGQGLFVERAEWMAKNNPRIDIGPIPTRVFGIGMHKTGTTSLHHAFEILGFKSSHWPSAHWAKQVFTEMKYSGQSPLLDKSYAACDLPIPLLYKELDKAYPGSKFILTVRSEESWLQSVERHWDERFNQYRCRWDTDPFTHRVHKELYGQRNFDREVFLARYRRHNAEVREHFKNRPGDLLDLNLESLPFKTCACEWEPLCAFLGHPVPNVEYPQSYRTVT